jgi:hypothetical protein
MKFDIDLYINLMRSLSFTDSKNEELSEQGEAAPSGGGSTEGYPKVPKWEEFYQTKRGKANSRERNGRQELLEEVQTKYGK